MTKKEAIKKVLRFENIFPVPYVIRFTVEAEENYRKYMGGHFDPVEDTGTYAVFSQTNSGWKEIKPGYYRDYFGVVWNKTKDRTLGFVDNPPVQAPSLRNFSFPDASDLPVYQYQAENNKNYPDHFHILSIGFTLFERAWSLVGMENLLLWMLSETAFVHDLLDKIADYNVALIKKAAQIGGIDCVRFGDDWAGQNGLLMGKDLWLEFINPPLNRMSAEVRKQGLTVAQHCCGKVDSLLPEMIDSGIEIFDPFQPEVMSVNDIFSQYYGQISFLGGLSIQKTMPFGTREDVERESFQLLSNLGQKGGYIFSPSHALTGDIPLQNIEVLLHIANNQGEFIKEPNE